MQDKLIRAIVPEEGIQITAAISTNLVERSRQIHHMTPVATAALGRTLTIASIMGSHLKIENGSVTIQIKGNGSLGTICCVAAPDGFVRGYLQNPTACGDMPLRPDGKLNVGQGVGRGYLMVIKDIGLKDPMTGTVALVNGEIAEDMTYYFAESEQIPSACGLGVLIDTDYTVKAAGGFLVQLLPHATDKGITQLEQNITQLPPVTTMLAQGLSLKEMIQKILASFSVQSQRYVKEGAFEYVIPPAIDKIPAAREQFIKAMEQDQRAYDNLAAALMEGYVEELLQQGVELKAARRQAEKRAIEDARYVLPNACATRLIMTANARSLKNFFRLRCCNRAQWEIRALAEEMYKLVYAVAPTLFAHCGPSCVDGVCTEGAKSCGQMESVRSHYQTLRKAIRTNGKERNE